MNLVETLLKAHSRVQCNKVIAWVGNQPDRFRELVDVYLHGPYRITQRAAWPLSYCVQQYPDLAKPHLKRLILYAEKDGMHPAVRRNTMRMLQFIDIPKGLHGRILDLAFRQMQDQKEPVAIRIFSMTVIAKLAHRYPEVGQELRSILEDQLPYATSGFITRARKIMNNLNG